MDVVKALTEGRFDRVILAVGAFASVESAHSRLESQLDVVAREVYGGTYRQGEPVRFLLLNDDSGDAMAQATERWADWRPLSAAAPVDLPDPDGWSDDDGADLLAAMPAGRLDLCLACPDQGWGDGQTWNIIHAVADAGIEVLIT